MRSWIIGSDPEADVVVPRQTVSGRHCCLLQTASGFVIQDMGSANGTHVNGKRIECPTSVSRGDAITLGRSERLPWPVDPDGMRPDCVHVGREPENEIVLGYPMVSGYHARILRVRGQAVIEDLGSRNGTHVGVPDRPVKRAVLLADASVYLGSFRIAASRLLEGGARLGSAPHHSLTVEGHDLVLGRSPGCDQVLDFPMISSRHARLVRNGKQLFVEDLGSSNGTFVNGTRIKAPVAVRAGDAIGLGSFTLTLTGTNVFELRNSQGNMTVEAKGVTVEVPGRRLLEEVSLTIHPSEFVGLMGPSGAGKTTLMGALNGYTPPSRGKVIFNGQDLYARYSSFQGQIGYVPQEDIIHRDLTVGRALYFTARLRLPEDFSDEDIRSRVREVLKQLGLAGTEHVLVGSPEKKGISGGQRKRVNLAMELLTDPSVLFLDEPTSGLSSEDTILVMRLLRQLADGGKTILLTIHQPSLEAFRLLDNLVVIAKDSGGSDPGRLAYYGPAYPDAVLFFNPAGIPRARPGTEPTPDEVLRGLGKAKTSEWVKAYGASRYRKEYVDGREAQSPGVDSPTVVNTPRGEAVAQWKTLTRRCLAVKIRDAWNTAILLAQAPIIAVLIVLVFGKDASGKIDPGDPESWSVAANAVSTTVFDLVLAAIWFGCSNSAREIVAERAIYHRERMVNLRIGSYVASKVTVLGGLCLFQCVVLMGIVYAGSGLKGPLLSMFAVLFLASMVGLAVGLLASATARTPEVAIALVPLLVLPMLILGGAMQPVHKMSPVMKPASLVMPSRWAFEGLLLQEVARQPKFEPTAKFLLPVGGQRGAGPKPQDMAEKSFPAGSERVGPGASILVLLAMLSTLLGAVLTVLRLKDIH